MKKLIALSVAVAAIAAHADAFAGPGRRPSFDDIDADEDGVVTNAEFIAPALEHFDELDTDADGVVTVEEFVSRLQTRFEEVDTDDDGVVSEDELRAGRKRSRG